MARKSYSPQFKFQVNRQTAAQLTFDQQSGQTGFCAGDSGGPVIFESGGSRYVAGIAVAIIDQQCAQASIAARVSGMFETFVQPYIDGTPTLPDSCDRCGDSAKLSGEACAAVSVDCLDSTQCVDYLSCVRACSDDACISGCAITHPDGFDQSNAVDDCICTVCAQCESESSNQPYLRLPRSCDGRTTRAASRPTGRMSATPAEVQKVALSAIPGMHSTNSIGRVTSIGLFAAAQMTQSEHETAPG